MYENSAVGRGGGMGIRVGETIVKTETRYTVWGQKEWREQGRGRME